MKCKLLSNENDHCVHISMYIICTCPVKAESFLFVLKLNLHEKSKNKV